MLVGAEADADPVAGADRAGPLHVVAVDLDLSAGDRLRGEGTGLEEACGPEPLVEPDAVVRVVG